MKMIRENLVSSAVNFLQDPSVANSPLDQRVAFLTSKNLTQEEVDAALARAAEDAAAPSANAPSYAYSQQMMTRQAPPGYGFQGSWQPPPQQQSSGVFNILVMILAAAAGGGAAYGAVELFKRLVKQYYPPTPSKLEQDKQDIAEQFDKMFALYDQIKTDTEALKASEEARTERLDTAMHEVEGVIGDLKSAHQRREDDARRINDEVRGLRDLVPRAMEAHKESTDARLKELNAELKSLKTLVANRMGTGASRPPAPSVASFGAAGGSSSSSAGKSSESGDMSLSNGTSTGSQQPAAGSAPPRKDASTPSSRAAIPAWQREAANKGGSGGNPTSAINGGAATTEAST